MYCICGKQNKAGYSAMHERDSSGAPIRGTFNYDFWVCANCLRPSQRVFIELTNRYAPRAAVSIVSAVGHGDGRSTITWATSKPGERIQTMTFRAYPRRTDMTDQGRDVCIELWKRLDSAIDTIRSGTPTPEQDKARASALAEVIALVMEPFYWDPQAVLKESMTRWTARQEGREHESPGLAETLWKPASPDAPARNGGAKPKPVVKLDGQKITFIKHCLNNNIQTAETLAGMFDCTIDDIKAAMDS